MKTQTEVLKMAFDRAAPTGKGYVIIPDDAFQIIKEALAQPEQEPVAWYRDENGIRIYYESAVWDDATPLYTTPPQCKPPTALRSNT